MDSHLAVQCKHSIGHGKICSKPLQVRILERLLAVTKKERIQGWNLLPNDVLAAVSDSKMNFSHQGDAFQAARDRLSSLAQAALGGGDPVSVRTILKVRTGVVSPTSSQCCKMDLCNVER
jgi:hypothetical protein